MILNPTHEITLSGLPSEILDAYVRYKKGSRAIVAWLVQYGSASYKGARTLPIKELAALARQVSSKINQVPEVIHFHFKETIAARRCLSRFFRSEIDASEEEVDTVNHEHFTNSLCDIYSNLCERCRTIDAQRLAPRVARRSYGSTSLRNHYDCLPVEAAADVVEMLQESSLDCYECSETTQTGCQGQGNAFQIEDDAMSVAIETMMLLEKAREVYATVADCWSQAGNGKVCFIAAAATTNVAWTYLREIETQLKDIKMDTSLASLHRQCCLFGSGTAITKSAASSSKEHSLLIELEESECALKHYSNGHQLRTNSCACIQKPADYIPLSCTNSQSQPPKFQAAILDNILHLIQQAKSAPALVFKCTPCFAEVGYLLSHLKDQNYTFQCTLAMHLLITSYTAYYKALPVPASISLCRISALKLATQGASSIAAILSDKPTFPCQCPQTLAYHLSNLQHELESYAKHKRWDIYFQSPWVAGNHIIEMLDMLSYYGMRLFHYRHFVGAILHSYNILQQLGGLDKVPIFEEICHIFKHVLFPGGSRPTSNFKNSWSRFIGARLRFKKGHKGHNHRESWCMAIPTHEARNAAGLSTDQIRDNNTKFDYGRLDPLIRLKQQDWHAHGDTRNNETIPPGGPLEKRKSSPTSRPKSKSSSSAEASSSPLPPPDSYPLTSTLLTLSSSLTPSPSSSSSTTTPPLSLPPSSLNLLSLFHLSQSITSSITSTLHHPSSSNPDQVHNCICFVTTLLEGADRITSARQAGKLDCWNKNERNVVEAMKKEMKEREGEGKNMLWDF